MNMPDSEVPTVDIPELTSEGREGPEALEG
jgi:hypothetical protein